MFHTLSFSRFYGSSWVAEAGEFGSSTRRNLGDGCSGVLPLSSSPSSPRVEFNLFPRGNLLTPSGMSQRWGRMCPTVSASACTARTERGTADRGEMVKPCVFCSLTARCLHLGPPGLLTLLFPLTFHPSDTCSPHARGRAACLLLGELLCCGQGLCPPRWGVCPAYLNHLLFPFTHPASCPPSARWAGDVISSYI